ncbi:hypothetical protein ACS0TY_035849 [Phlomoides rotata]
MGSHAQSKLPIIKVNEMSATPITISWKSTSDSVRQALESYGCFVLTYENTTTPELHKAVFGVTEELFSLPLDTKKKHTSEVAGFGYGGKFSVMPLFEYFGIEDDGTLEAKKNFTNIMWPNGHDKFCEALHSYCKLLTELDRTVMKMVVSSYGLEKYYDEIRESSFYMTRIMKYGLSEKESDIGLVAHRDKSFMTVIGTNEVKGLQIETRDGDWIDFEPSVGKFIVIVCEAFMAWSNGRIYCPLHKVIARGKKEKYSIGIFSFVRDVLQVPEELVDDENPLKFKPFKNLDFLEYCKEGGPKMEAAIHTYCGL